MIAVIGNGGLGTGLAGLLTRLGLGVSLLGRDDTSRTEHEIFLPGSDAPYVFSTLPPTSATLAKALAVFVTVKAFDLKSALTQHLRRFPTAIPIVPVGNGHIYDELCELRGRYPDFLWRLGVCTIACRPVADGRIRLGNPKAKLIWGPLSKAEPRVATESAWLELDPGLFQWQTDPFPAYRTKWIFNTTLNTLAAALRLRTNGDVLAHSEELEAVFSEAYALAQNLWPSGAAEKAKLYGELLILIDETRLNQNSMNQDRELGKRTESEFLAGLAENYPGFPILKKYHRTLIGAAS